MADEKKKCLIISGAPETDIDYYKNYITGRFIICADSGYTKCRALGVEPDLVLGDFDSSPVPDTDAELIVLPSRKDDTDTFYAVKTAIARGYGDILILGGIGSRIDHTYENIITLNYCVDRAVKAVMINKNNKIRIADKSIDIYKSDGYEYFSIFALFDNCEGLTTRGTGYNLTDFTLTPDNLRTQSNYFAADTVSIKFNKGKLLIIQSND